MLQSDSANVVSYIKGTVVAWNARVMMNRVRRIIETLHDFEVVHVYREANRLANHSDQW